MEIIWEELRRTHRSHAAADLAISEGDAVVKYNIYLKNGIRLIYQSVDQNHAELAASLLKLAGVMTEVKRIGNVWHIQAYTDMLAAGHEKLRRALAEIVRRAVENGWIDEEKAKRWLKKLEKGYVVREGLPKYEVRLSGGGALVVRYVTTNSNNVMREVQRLRGLGLVEGKHFSVKMPGGGRKKGHVSILKRGLERIAWLSAHGEEVAEMYVEYILLRARKAGEEVYEKAREIIEKGKAKGSLTLKGFEKEVEIGGKKYFVKVIDGGAELDRGRTGKTLLRIRITAEVDGVRHIYDIAFGRYGKNNEAAGYAVARAGAPGGREKDIERLTALIKALTGVEPNIYRKKKGVVAVCGMKHLEGFRRFAEPADAVEKWLNSL
jgi:hypothetical protein